MRIDGDRVGAVEVRDAAGVARDRRAAPPYAASTWSHRPCGSGDVRQLADGVDRAGVRRAGHGRDRERRQAGRDVALDGLARPARRAGGSPSSDGTMTSVSAGKPSRSRARATEKCVWSLA